MKGLLFCACSVFQIKSMTRACVCVCVCTCLVVVSELVLQDVSVGPVRLRPRERDGVWSSAQLVHRRYCTGNCGRPEVDDYYCSIIVTVNNTRV